jgi:hypothetical protein
MLLLKARTPICDSRIVAPIVLLCWLLSGCGGGGVPLHVEGAYQPTPHEGLDFGKFNQLPRARLGGLPYPGSFTFFNPVDPNNLGTHSYAGGGSEVDRGFVYTCHAGFIDIAHARKTIDMCKYCQVRFEMALLHDWSAFQIGSREPSVYIVRLQYPSDWKTLPAPEKQRFAHELSIRLGQRMALIMLTWHELLTWYGYQASMFPEKQSAFTYDDTGSHAFGVLVAGRALHDSREWDAAVTDALNTTLREADPRSADETMAAAQKVESVWWQGFEPLKRQVESGLDRPIVAWVVPELDFCRNAAPWQYATPTLDNVFGRNFHDLVRIEINPNVEQSDQIRQAARASSNVIDVDKHLPVILQSIRNELGEAAVRPY